MAVCRGFPFLSYRVKQTFMLDYRGIMLKYYEAGSPLFRTLWIHSECVARKALECLDRRGIDADRDFVREAAMLHDIGIVRCNAPSIFCTGAGPYIRHGMLGAEMLRNEGLPRHALVCERHTGSGLSADDIIKENLPPPPRDMLPLSVEERVICYADKFFSKSRRLDEEKPVDKIMAQMAAHGADVASRFADLHAQFG